MSEKYIFRKKISHFISLFLFCFILVLSLKKFSNLTFNSNKSLISIPLERCVSPSVNFAKVSKDLKDSKAYCTLDNLLFDSDGKMIYFYHLKECKFSNPSEIIKKQDIELDRLNGAYKVIKIYCKNS